MFNTCALQGIKVLDFTRFMPGQYAAMLLAEAGAEVVKIEAPGFRRKLYEIIHGKKPTPEAEQRWNAVSSLDRSKNSIVIDLTSEAAREIVYRMAKKADVIIEGNRPGVMKKLGLDYDTIKKINSRIIFCSVTGYGQDGPYNMLPARDLTCMAMAGILSVINEGDIPPLVPGVKLSDLSGAMYSAIGILMAIIAREKTGKGQFVDISMSDGALSWLAAPFMNYSETGQVPDKGEIFLSGKRPAYNVYKTKDDNYISIAIRETHFWEKLCKKLGREDLIPYQNPGPDKFNDIVSDLQEIFLTKSRDEWFEELKDEGVGKVHHLNELDSDPQFRHRQMILDIDCPGIGKVKHVGNPIKLSDTPLRIKDQSPSPGQHTLNILAEAGYSEEEIDNFYKEGVVA